tara:strand:+ start:3165 stop:4151 length:987 start_codon:yes stop_codon:yes gene_type:complete
MKQELNTLKNEHDDATEIVEDLTVQGPGHMLKEAREMRGLSEQQVADKLNFRTRLVQDIEINKFDRNLPEAFNRGYLKNYAKLVNIAEADVLNSYDQLAVTQRECAGMQSFSKGTAKQAEHNMLMWITYLILAILFTATVVWWLQTPSEQPEPIEVAPTEISALENSAIAQSNLTDSNSPTDESNTQDGESMVADINAINTETNITVESTGKTAALKDENMSLNSDSNNAQASLPNEKVVEQSASTLAANVVFTFSGDCWVNIYDATGERLAWGVKKSGYIMRISGQAPFSITLGKPELVQIDYNDVPVDLAVYNAGNIAKFSLPLVP